MNKTRNPPNNNDKGKFYKGTFYQFYNKRTVDADESGTGVDKKSRLEFNDSRKHPVKSVHPTVDGQDAENKGILLFTRLKSHTCINIKSMIKMVV